ncbi:hypothetical protein JTE90_017133 [Oedothorax gibbosus]|uniref:Uncharacterized protein n=1 Tax=Oedothorax gibbosus TaxID=931172 RepID=A0AAV6UCU2_9ARAC|nr:hypothetical protein JTE90_017133 [Oedothorax gibbosus]
MARVRSINPFVGGRTIEGQERCQSVVGPIPISPTRPTNGPTKDDEMTSQNGDGFGLMNVHDLATILDAMARTCNPREMEFPRRVGAVMKWPLFAGNSTVAAVERHQAAAYNGSPQRLFFAMPRKV